MAAKGETVIPRDIEEEMKASYIDYAMSVIVGRALPDVRDGLKPVHRRILYAMKEGGMTSDKPYKKSARIVGDVLGKYHPHGDVAVYDSIVRMVQDFSLRYPLLDGQGNFGSVDGDAAAAMRYTEIRLAKTAEEILEDIDKNTIDLVPNYDGSLQEPVILPSKFPNLLVNGSSGIAVGMATNIPPHNLGEVIDATIMQIDDPKASLGELMTVLKGPDFPTGGLIYGTGGIISAYATGRGLIKIRARSVIERKKDLRSRIIITEIPYQVNKTRIIESIADLVRNKKIEGIADLRDESDREGIRIVIELKKRVNAEIVLNQLYKHTQLETTFGVINLVLVGGEPKVLTLEQTISHFIDHRKKVVTRRTKFELRRAEERAHVLEGLMKALDKIDAVIKTIRSSKAAEEARKSLIKKFKLTGKQAKAILEMRLQRLTALEREKIEKEHAKLKKDIAMFKKILTSKEEKLKIIKNELLDIKSKYNDERRTEIVAGEIEIEDEDLIPVEDMVITITNTGYIKRLPADTYRKQRRGGKGIIGMETKEEDFVEDLFVASTHDYMLFFTDRGKVHWLKVYRIPAAGRYARGKAIVNLLKLGEDEKVTTTIPVKEFDESHYLIFATKKGIIKKTALSAYSNPRKTGIIAINLVEGDEVVSVRLTNGEQEVLIGTKKGKAIKFSEKDVRVVGRPARGVRGIKLRKGDRVIGMEIIREDASLLTITENGYGKRTALSGYRTQRRGGQGVINIITSDRNGDAVDIKMVEEEDELMVTSSGGIIIRIPVNAVSIIGRNTQGVRIMKMKEGDKVVAVARVISEDNGE
ncbi:MAG: DNA gyrase subunit A [Candidatus Hydrothermarchaeales archaeon]